MTAVWSGYDGLAIQRAGDYWDSDIGHLEEYQDNTTQSRDGSHRDNFGDSLETLSAVKSRAFLSRQ